MRQPPASAAARIIVDAQHKHLNLWADLFDLRSGLDAVQMRHRDIHNHHIRQALTHKLHGVLPITHLADHAHISLAIDQDFQPLAHNHMIIGEKDA
jgi:hypothetical protein